MSRKKGAQGPKVIVADFLPTPPTEPGWHGEPVQSSHPGFSHFSGPNDCTGRRGCSKKQIFETLYNDGSTSSGAVDRTEPKAGLATASYSAPSRGNMEEKTSRVD